MLKFISAEEDRFCLAIFMALLAVCMPRIAIAEVTKEASSTNESDPKGPTSKDRAASIEAAKKNAEKLGDAGRGLFNQGKYGSAWLEFQASNRAFPSWRALSGMSTCSIKLKRYDEALDTLETMLQQYGDQLPEGAKNQTRLSIDDLRKRNGAFMVTSATPGAWVLVDGRLRGEHPLAAPIPMMPGRHWVRVYKEGFAIYETEVDIQQGGMKTVDVTLVPLSNSGRLRVDEVAGKKMEVVVDGVPVGITPWDGPVSPGAHTVFLRPIPPKNKANADTCDKESTALVPEDAGDPTSHEMGTEPQIVKIESGQTNSVNLTAERLETVVRIEPESPDAEVYLNGINMGRGAYIGRVKPGKHVVKTKAEGYFTESREIVTTIGEESAPSWPMKKDVNAPKWTVAGRVLVESRLSVPLTNSFASELEASCSGICQQNLGTGVNAVLRAGYEWPNGFGVGGTFGYFQMEQSRVGFEAILTVGPENLPGRANDSTLLQNFTVGAFGSYKLGQRFPVRLGLGAGFMYGNVTYTRTGTFNNQAVGPVEQAGVFPWIYVEPEVRVGVQMTERWALGVAISGLVLFAPRIPVWTEEMKINAHNSQNNQLGTFKGEKITGNAFFMMNQGLYIQYGF